MKDNYSIEIFAGPRNNSVFQDTKFLARVLEQKAKAASRYSKDLEKTVKDVNKYIIEARREHGECKDTQCFLAALEVTKAGLHNQAREAGEDARHFRSVAKSLTENVDELYLSKAYQIEEMAFKSLRDSFSKGLAEAEEARDRYHRLNMDSEVSEVKQLLATTESRMHQLVEREQKLKEKIEKAKEEYILALSSANETCQHLDSAATTYQEAWRPLAEKRATIVTATLASSCLGGSSAKRHLDQIDQQRLLSSLGMTETIVPPRYQEYTSTEKRSVPILGDGLPLPQRRRKAIALEDFRKCAPNQLSLKGGERLKVLLTADPDGMAFGEKKGKFGQKKRGFFPARLVQLLD